MHTRPSVRGPRFSAAVLAAAFLGLLPAAPSPGDEPLNIGGRRELFVDRLLVDRLDGAELRLHRPHDAGPVFRFDRPWDGKFSGYCTVIHADGLYRLYYRGKTESKADGIDEVTCYAQSVDGVVWTRPNLGLHSIAGSRDNNVILVEPQITHNFSPFLDSRPGVAADERFKALGGTIYKNAGGGLMALASADGIRWRKLQPRPVLTQGAFDSQNVAFWSAAEQCYVCYFRTFTQGVSTAAQWKPGGLRSITRSVSSDFRTWSEPQRIEFHPPQTEHLYTSQTHPYFRAPHLYVALAARFIPQRPGITAEEARELAVDPAYFKAARDVSDTVLLTSRGKPRFDRAFDEALLPPGPRLQQWVSRNNYCALGVVQTGPGEMSLYANQDYAQPGAHLRRYTLRLDGFASVRASGRGGELLTRPLLFAGRLLQLNMATSAAGGLRVEIQDAAGNVVPGFSLADSVELYGDSVERTVAWKGGSDLSPLAGKAVRLRFQLREADLYSLQFTP